MIRSLQEARSSSSLLCSRSSSKQRQSNTQGLIYWHCPTTSSVVHLPVTIREYFDAFFEKLLSLLPPPSAPDQGQAALPPTPPPVPPPEAASPGPSCRYVSFVDSAGNKIRFELTTSLACLVNEKPILNDITLLTYEGGTLHVKGTPQGDWAGKLSTSIPHVGHTHQQILRRIAELYSELPSASVAFTDVEGNHMLFRLRSNGCICLTVNGDVRFELVTVLAYSESRNVVSVRGLAPRSTDYKAFTSPQPNERRSKWVALSALWTLAAALTHEETFTDSDGDEVTFQLALSPLSLNYLVGRQPKVLNVHTLYPTKHADGTKIHVDGTSAGTWRSARATVIPRSSHTGTVVQHILRLFSLTLMARVSFTDTDGDAIVLSLASDGSLSYFVNSQLRVHHLTSLEIDTRGTIHLDGASAGAWRSARTTTPTNPSIWQAISKLRCCALALSDR